MNENDLADILAEVRHWLINGSDGALKPSNQLMRVYQLRALTGRGAEILEQKAEKEG